MSQHYRNNLLAEYEFLYNKRAPENISHTDLVNSVFGGTIAYIEGVSSISRQIRVVPPKDSVATRSCHGPASYAYECLKLNVAPAALQPPHVVIERVRAQKDGKQLADHELRSAAWQNWNRNQSTNATVHSPSTLEELQAIVKDAKKVRVAGFGHSWSPIVATHDDNVDQMVLIRSDRLNKVLSNPQHVRDYKNVTVESGVSNQALREWLEKAGIQLTIASNVVLTDVFLIGVATAACHGAGYEWGSVADFIKAVTIINADGQHVTYTDLPADQHHTLALPPNTEVTTLSPQDFNHYKVTLGMLGVIYSITVSLVDLVTLDCYDFIVDLSEILDPNKLKELIERYNGWVEIFWVPVLQDDSMQQVLVKTWSRAPPGTPSTLREGNDQSENGNKLNIGRQKMRLSGTLDENSWMRIICTTMYADADDHKLYNWFEAIHFQDGISKMRVEDTEFAFPIIDNNYEIVSNSFRDMKDSIIAKMNAGQYIVDVVCEMRFTNGSNATLAHYPKSQAEKWVHMEFLGASTQGQGFLEIRWHNLVQEIAAKWQALGGNPHWAKGWHTIEGIFVTLMGKDYVTNFNNYRNVVDPAKKFLPDKLARIFSPDVE